MEKFEDGLIKLLKEALDQIPDQHRKLTVEIMFASLLLVTLLDFIIVDPLPFIDEITLFALTGILLKNKDKLLVKPQ